MNEYGENDLLERFNNRDRDAFSQIYDRYYVELNYYAQKLYWETNVMACDVVHDIFIRIWEKKSLRFNGLVNIKAYLYTSIRNAFLDTISHNKHVTDFAKKQLQNSDYNVAEMVESETFSIISESVRILPEECAKVFKLYLDGWSIKEIATQLGKAPSTVYSQKQEAIELLRKKLSQRKFFCLMTQCMIGRLF